MFGRDASSPNPSTGTSGHDLATGTSVRYTVMFGTGDTSAETCIVNFGQDSSFAGEFTAQGNQDGNSKGDFFYAPPSSFLALCTDNLSAPSISAVESLEHFNTVLYTGTEATNAITGVGFKPDYIWLKQITSSSNHGWSDAVRGANAVLSSNLTDAEASSSTYVESFDSDGFTVGSNGWLNANTKAYAGWCWKGNGVSGGTLNEDGDIDSYVNVNTAAGFSVAKYTGNNTAGATIGHGLSQKPYLTIIKDRDNGSTQWVINPYGSLLINKYGYFGSGTFTTDSSNTFFYDSTATTVKISNHAEVNASATDFIMYNFHSVEGYCMVGGYKGNGNDDGTFVYTGFRPAYITLKALEGSAHWVTVDNKENPYNEVRAFLTPNLAQAQTADGTRDMDFVSNGFKARSSYYEAVNGSGVNYIYLAYAESPFKTANAR